MASMFRSKKDVDRHVTDILSKIHNENERNLRGYSFARLYFQLKDYETAKKYLAGYLSVRDHHAPAHKLMAQIYETTKNVERALHSYKRSLEIDSNQKDIILKICELYCQLPVDHETARYWADRADQLFPHHEIVFRLRECLVSAEGEPDRQELERLLASELSAQPMNVHIRIKLLKLYLDTERVKEAYVHAVKVESKRPFTTSSDWYYCLVDIFEAYQEEVGQELDSDFYINFLSVLDHLVFLTLTEPHALRFGYDQKTTKHSSSINDAVSAMCTFDQVLKRASDKDLREGPWLYFLHHMKGQLYYHMGTLVMKRAIKDQGNWKEACRVGAALFLISYTFKPQNLLQEVWFSRMNERQKLFTNFFQQAALRTSCSGHIIISLCKEDKSKWLQKIKHDVCLIQVQERTYNRLFSSNGQKQTPQMSYFLKDTAFINTSLEFPSLAALKDYDKSAYKLCSDSLHHLVWLQLHQLKENDEINQSHESYLFEVFKGLQYGNNNLSKGSPESLCLLDLEAFLQAAVYTTSLLVERRSSVNPRGGSGDILLSVSPDICEPLCTKEQASWWKAAYYLFTNSIREKFGEQRRILQRGLEVIRGVGNHGLDVQLVVYLARMFGDRAASSVMTLKENNQSGKFQSEKIHLNHRCAHYWNVALGMLEKLEQNQVIRTPKECMFVNYNKDLSSDEVTKLIEEGHLYLACQEMNSGKLEEAVSIFSKLTSPFASYYMALALKRSALQQVEGKSMRDIDAKTWNIRTALLNKAREAMYLTMDRLKGDKSHPLNKDFCVEIEDIERELSKDLNSSSPLDDSGGSEEVDEYDGVDSKQMSPVSTRASLPNQFSRLSRQSTPRPDSNFLTLKGKNMNLNEKTKHLQPSPERLDAQIRALALNQESLVKTVLEHQQTLLDTTKAIVEEQKQHKEAMEQLKKIMEDLRITITKGFSKPSHRKSYVRSQGDDDEEEEDYNDFEGNTGYVDYFVDDAGEFEFRRGGYQHYVPPQLVPEAPGSSGLSYVHQPPLPGAPPGPPPPLSHYGYQYPPHPPLAPPPPPSGTAIPEHPQYFHSAPAQGLSFSEGQQLPQFRFHVGSPGLKPPGAGTLGTLASPAVSASTIAPPIATLTSKPPPIQHAASLPWSKSGSVPHAFQIPLPPLPTNAAFSPAQPPAVLSAPTPFISPSTAAAATQKPIQTTCSPSTPVTTNHKTTPPAQTFQMTTNSPLLNTSTGSSIAGPAASSFLNRTPGTPHISRSRRDSDMGESAGSETEGHDIEKEVLGDFKPVIPLPDEVVVQTGEENEKVLFEERAKLFRFVDHEWKERGIGPVRLLHHESTGKVRLLMRRDQVLKVCANHFILSSMQLSPMKDSDKAWVWAAQDFADETVKTEKFCIRFKTVDIASSFKRAFEQAVSIVKEAELSQGKANESDNTVQTVPNPLKTSVQTSNVFSTKFLPKHGSWSCPVCYVSNAADKPSCEACETLRPQQSLRSPVSLNLSPQTSSVTTGSFSSSPLAVPPLTFKTGEGEVTITTKTIDKTNEQPASALLKQLATTQLHAAEVQKSPMVADGGKTVLGGFTFSSTPVLKDSSPEPKDREILVVHTKAKNGPQVTKVDTAKPSPFSGFSFKSSSTPSSGFSFTPSKSSDILLVPASSSSDTETIVSSSVETRTITALVADTRTPVSSLSSDARTCLFVSASPKTPVSSTSSSEKSEQTGQQVFGANSDVSNLMFSSLSNSSGSAVGFRKSENFQGFLGAGVPLFVTVTKEGRRVSGEFSGGEAPEEFEPTTEFKPAVPLPALVEIKTGEEGEEKLFGERAKLFRYDNEGKEWKERGIGELKILYLPSTGKYRILMRREQVLKICANHNIIPEIKLSPLASSDRSWVWLAQDYSEGTLCEEKFAVKFKNTDTAQLFHSVFEECQAKIKSSKGRKAENPMQIPPSTPPDNQKPLCELFKPPPDSWECSVCYVRNDASKQRCISCESLKPGRSVSASQPPEPSSSSSTLTCGEIKKSFADLFKPESGSWECQTCYVRNSKDKTSCVACETPKPGCESLPQKPTQQVSSNVFGQFSFGSVPKSSAAETSSSDVPSNFVFGNTSQSAVTRTGFVFGSKPSTASTSFGFGQSSVSQPYKESFGFKPAQSISATNNVSTVFGGANISSNFRTTSIAAVSSVSAASNSISIPPVTVPPTYVFGNVSSNTTTFGTLTSDTKQQDSSESVEFRFGSPQKYEFSFSGVRARSPSKTPKSPKAPGTPTDVEDEDEVEPSDVDNIYFQPVIPLPPKVDVKTGEEDETVVFSHRAKLFRFDHGEWKERGIGDIKILFNPTSKSFRLLMRREQVLKVCLNHKLTADIKFKPKGDKSLQWAATDFSDNEPKPEQLAVRFKTPETVAEFKNAINAVMEQLSPRSASESKITSTDSFKSAESSTLVQNEKEIAPTSKFSMHTKLAGVPAEKSVPDSALVKSTSEVSVPAVKDAESVASIVKPKDSENVENVASTVKPKDSENVAPASTAASFQSPMNASTFSFKMAGLSPAPVFSLSSRFGDSQLPAKSTFGSLPQFTSSIPSPSATFPFKKPDDDKDIEVVESKLASKEKRESAERLQLPSNFYLYEDKPPCPGCRGCETGHSEIDDVVEVIYQAEPSAAQIAAATKLLLPPTFYLYENKPPCPGCRGCRDEIPDHVGSTCEEEKVASSFSAESKPETETIPFFSNTSISTFSFADAAAKGASFNALAAKVSPSKMVFPGAGAPAFASLNESKGSEDDDNVVAAPDIHFEPLVPLPDLVDIKTGEEEETPVFTHRAKLYRYDSVARQWKERGIGDFKILKHNEKCRFRIILRREQVHKVACNHYISPNMKMAPMGTSETAVCWNAVDYADGHPDTSNFAVKFKNKEILGQFQSKFDECVAAMSEKTSGDSSGSPEKTSHVSTSCAGTSPANEQQCAVVSPSAHQTDSTDKGTGHGNQEENREKSKEDTQGQGDNYGEEDDDDDNEVLFEKRVSFEIFDEQSKTFKKAGLGPLRVLYDDSVFGYRITMTSDQEVLLSDHIIAVQTSLRTDKKVAVWAAIDMVVDPPKRRQFRAAFSSVQAVGEFETIFNEGKQTAIQAEIVENVDDPPMNYLAYETETNASGKA